MKKKIFTLMALFVFSIIVMLCGLFFIFDKTIVSMLVFIILMTILFLCYPYCIKEITLPEGYTILQALSFYRKCVKAGINSNNYTVKRYKVLKSISKEIGITISSDEKTLWKLYCNGKEIDSIIKLTKNKKI